MTPFTPSSTGTKTFIWDDLGTLERLKLILQHADLFLSLRLITQSELDMINEMHESEWEYILDREDQPLLTSIHLKKNLEEQYHRYYLESALESIFCKTSFTSGLL